MMISQMIEQLTWILESNPVAFGNPASEEDVRDEEDLAGLYMRSIIAELKDMKPRILSLDEAVNADVCWLEDKKTGSVIPVSVFYESKWTVNAYPPGKCGINYDVAKYGKTYRCWNGCPDEELRKNEKWGMKK